MRKLYLLALLIAIAAVGCAFQKSETPHGSDTSALRQVQSIQLPDVTGRIDHMSIDSQGGRLFVAALGNNTVEVIDLKAGNRTEEIKNLQEPQGVVYIPEGNQLLVSNGEGDSLDIYDGTSLKLLNQVELGDDPDNIRYDATTGYAYVGYGTGNSSALGVVDVDRATKVADIKLSGHPESFQLEGNGKRIFVNVPTSEQVAVVDREKGAVVDTWPIEIAKENFPMALDESSHRLFIGTRSPAELLILDTDTGKQVTSLDSSQRLAKRLTQLARSTE